MTRSIESLAKPELLKWAREVAGRSPLDVAQRLAVSQEVVLGWEAGSAAPSLAKARALAEYYKRPLAVFFLPEPPKDFQPLSDFRHLPRDVHPAFSPELRAGILFAEFRQTAAKNRLSGESLAPSPLVGMGKPSDAPSELAAKLRALLQVKLNVQFEWKDFYEALREWTRSLERLGVLVFHIEDVEVVEMRGLALLDDVAPIIGLNSKDPPQARVFTLIHEAAHLAIRQPGISNLRHVVRAQTPKQQIEALCNQIAAETLVPSDALLEERVVAKRSQENWHEAEIETLATHFGVSREVILRRLLSLRRVTGDFVEAMIASYREDYSRRQTAPDSKAGFLPFHRRIVRRNGKLFTSRVLKAFYQDRINASEVSDLLGMKLGHLPKVEAEVFGRSSGYGGAS